MHITSDFIFQDTRREYLLNMAPVPVEILGEKNANVPAEDSHITKEWLFRKKYHQVEYSED